MEPWNKSLNFIFPTKYVIPKSLKFKLAIGQVRYYNYMYSTLFPSHHLTFTNSWYRNQVMNKNGTNPIRMFHHRGTGRQQCRHGHGGRSGHFAQRIQDKVAPSLKKRWSFLVGCLRGILPLCSNGTLLQVVWEWVLCTYKHLLEGYLEH